MQARDGLWCHGGPAACNVVCLDPTMQGRKCGKYGLLNLPNRPRCVWMNGVDVRVSFVWSRPGLFATVFSSRYVSVRPATVRAALAACHCFETDKPLPPPLKGLFQKSISRAHSITIREGGSFTEGAFYFCHSSAAASMQTEVLHCIYLSASISPLPSEDQLTQVVWDTAFDAN